MRGKPRYTSDAAARTGLIPARAGKTRAADGRRRSAGAHPRACGENLCTQHVTHYVNGSSPRVRGKRPWTAPYILLARLIPARAGKTKPGARRRESRPAHPRACGENLELCGLGNRSEGSSPRVRGKPRAGAGSVSGGGLIPARAGKTERREKLPFGAPGSSPRVRGKRGGVARRARASGLIPARAGKTDCQRATWNPSRAHPRACGENTPEGKADFCPSGSSPRVRGKRVFRRAIHPPMRLIPARAGKTAVHVIECEVGDGSSPRVRGKPEKTRSLCTQRGLIPARAGKTFFVGTTGKSLPAHPRACGENGSRASGRTCPLGSSPRVRGKP